MPVGIQITAKGADFVRRDLERLRRKIPQIAGVRIRDTLEAARKNAVVYPPMRPRQTYRRTGTYRRAWKVKSVGKWEYALVGQAIQNGRDYTRFVGGDETGAGQAWFHAGRWTQVATAVRRQAEKLPAAVRWAIEMGAAGAEID